MRSRGVIGALAAPGHGENAGRINEATFQQILDGARDALDPFVTPDGRVEVPIQGHIVTAKP